MTSRQSNRGRPRTPGARRKTVWIDEAFNWDIADGSQANQQLGPVGTIEGPGWTLVRTIMDLQLAPSSPMQVTGQQVAAYGIGLASQEAFTAGVLPDPNTESDFPVRGWVFRSRRLVRDVAAGTGVIQMLQEPIHIDIRSARKIDDSVLFAVFENNPVSATAFNVRFIGLMRTLFMLP